MVGRVQPITLMVALQAGQTDWVRPPADRSRPCDRVKMSESRETRLTKPAPPHVGPVGTLMYGWKRGPATKEKRGRTYHAPEWRRLLGRVTSCWIM